MLKQFLESVGGLGAGIVVIPTADPDGRDEKNTAFQALKALGATVVRLWRLRHIDGG